MKKRIIPIIISILLLGGIIYFSDALKVILTISKANLFIIFLIFFTWFVGIFVRSWRWWLLLRKSGVHLPLTKFTQIMKIYISGLFLSNITPAKSGDPIRSVLLKQTNNISIGKSVSSIIIERILDVVSVISLSLFITPLLLTQFTNFFPLFIPFVKKSKKKINNFALALSNSFSKFHIAKILTTILPLSLIIWGMEGLVIYLAFLSLGFEIPFLMIVTTMALATLIGVLSFLPGGIGSSELVFILIITHTFPLTITQVTSAALIGRIPFLMYSIVGAIFLSLFKYKYKILQ